MRVWGLNLHHQYGPKNTVSEQSFQQMAPGKLDINIQKNEAESLPNTIHKN